MDQPCTECGCDEARFVDDDTCFERFLESGGEHLDYDPVIHCGHLACKACGTRVGV